MSCRSSQSPTAPSFPMLTCDDSVTPKALTGGGGGGGGGGGVGGEGGGGGGGQQYEPHQGA